MASNPQSQLAALEAIKKELGELGFAIRQYDERIGHSCQPVIVATREPSDARSPWIDLTAHYDVDELDMSEAWVSLDLFRPFVKSGRLYCRGVANNLGPLVIRIGTLTDLASGDGQSLPGLCWIIQ